jgi:hypothetical protein
MNRSHCDILVPGNLARFPTSPSRRIEMNAHTGRVDIGPWLTPREQVAELLARYPNVSKNENRKILEFMKNGRHLEIGLLTSDEKLKRNLDAFMNDHRRHFRVGFGEAAAVVAMIAAFLLAAWLFWEVIGPSSL